MPCPDCGRGIVLGERSCPVSDNDKTGWHRLCDGCRKCVLEGCCDCGRVICDECDPVTYHPDLGRWNLHRAVDHA